MAIEYWLVLEGDLPIDTVARAAFPDPAERPAATGHANLLSNDLYDRYGYGVTIRAGHDGYFQGEADPEVDWLWEPQRFTQLTFRIDKKDPQGALRNLLPVVARMLDVRSEDAAFLLNGDFVLLSRSNGAIAKHRRAAWWDHYGWVDEIVPGPSATA